MVSETKKLLVSQLIKDLQSYPIVGLVNMENLPAPQLQKMKKMLKEKGVKIIMARKKLLNLALKGSKLENIQDLSVKIRGMPAFILTKDNPFTLCSIIQKNKSEAPAKAGQTSPKDIVVKAGPTNFAPGPIISEFASVGIKTKVDQGKLAILADATIVKEGEIINQKVAETLKRLDIKPMEIGLKLVAVWENGLVFEAKQLHIDEKEYAQNIAQAVRWSMNLAVEIVYLTSETTELILQKAFREAKAVALDGEIINDTTKEEILAKAEAQALSVKEAGNIQAQVEPKPKTESAHSHKKDKEDKAEIAPEQPAPRPVPKEIKVEPEVKAAPKAAEVPKVHHQEQAHKEAKAEIKVETKTEVHTNSPIIHTNYSRESEKMNYEKMKLEQIKKDKLPEFHPSYGDVKVDDAQELFQKLQKKGTLR